MTVESLWLQEYVDERLGEDRQAHTLEILRAKFGGVPSDLIDQVRAIQNIGQLSKLILRAAVALDLDAFRTQLPSRERTRIAENPWFQQLVNQRLCESYKAILVEILKDKFPEVPTEVAAKIQTIQDAPLLYRLFIHAGVSSELDAFCTQVLAEINLFEKDRE